MLTAGGTSWGLAVVDSEPYGSWKGFLEKIRDRGVSGVQLVTSDAHEGLRQAISKVFLGAHVAEGASSIS